VIGDVLLEEARDFLYEILDFAWADCMRAFPQADAQRRIAEWFGTERRRLDRLVEACAGGRLVDLYRAWLREYLPEGGVEIGLASSLLSCGTDPSRHALLEVFLRDYPRASEAYNRAVTEVPTGVRPLRTDQGELPFFATFEHQGRLVRAGAFIDDGGVRVGGLAFKLDEDRRLPLAAMQAAGVRSLAGKAIALVLQVRLGPAGDSLVLPYRGSLYMPSAHRLAGELAAAGLLPSPPRPLTRVRLGLLDRMSGLDAIICLPAHLVPYFGKQEVPASELGRQYRVIAAQAHDRLERFKDAAFRFRWQHENCADLEAKIAPLEARRRQLAQTDPKCEQVRLIWKDVKPLKIQMLDRMIRQIAGDWQARDLDYWDSRGAIMPWCVAMGGEDFYKDVIRNAAIYEETS